MSDEPYPESALDALLGATEQIIAHTAHFDLETKVAVTDRLERMRNQVMRAPLLAGAAPMAAAGKAVSQGLSMWRLPRAAGTHYAGLILLPPTDEHETCDKCNGQRVIGTGNG